MKLKPAHLALIAAAVGGAFFLKSKDAPSPQTVRLTPGVKYAISALLKAQDSDGFSWSEINKQLKEMFGSGYMTTYFDASHSPKERLLVYTMTAGPNAAPMQTMRPLFQLIAADGSSAQAFFISAKEA